MSSVLSDDKATTSDMKYSHLSPTSKSPPTKTGTYLDDEPAFDVKNLSADEKKDILAYASSTHTTDSDATTITPTTFTSTRTLSINSVGIPVIRFPLPSNELEISISTPEGELVYVSTREKRSSGNATLSDAEGRDLIASEYLFGPGRNPKIVLLERGGEKRVEMKVNGKWTGRRHNFMLPTGVEIQWRYTREIDPSASNIKGKKRSFLIMEAIVGDKRKETVRLAKLARNPETRTPGSKGCSAGNGGELVVDGNALESFGVDESIAVSSCLMMLKKEIDRRQIWVIAAVASGGS